MKQRLACGFATTILALCLGCTGRDQERAREKAEQAKRRARQELQNLGQQAKREAKQLDENVDDAMRGQPHTHNGPGADQKLRDAGQELRSAGRDAAVKLDRGTVIAKVKAKLATDVGLAAAGSVDVDTNGQVVTLRGTVSSPEQKLQAERAAAQVSGVTKVVNLLQVQP
jgi:osmotically-inducible protein OsmY